MGKQKGVRGLGRYFKVGLMAFAGIAAGAIPNSTISTIAQQHASQTVHQATLGQKSFPITNPTPIRAERQTPIGTIVPRNKRRVFGSIPQKHAKRHTNRIHASRKAKRKHRRAA